MRLHLIIWGTLLAFGIPLLLTPLVKKLAVAAGAIDLPGQRKVHQHPVPCWGGLGIFLGFAAALVAAVLMAVLPLTREVIGLLAGGLVVLVVGMLDDWKGISPLAKLAGQIAAAAVAVSFGIRMHFVTNPFGGIIALRYPLSVILTIAWLVAITNALNLVDGLDGLAAGIAAISAGIVSYVSFSQGVPLVGVCSLFLGASALGFLPHNWHPARIFMKDAGAMFLGFTLASLAAIGLTKSAAVFSLILPILILGIPISDMLLAIIRRLMRGQNILTADREHIHHRLLDLGLTHSQTVLSIYGVNLLLGGSAVLLTFLNAGQGLIVLFMLCAVVLFLANRAGLLSRQRLPSPGPADSRARQAGTHK
ncbi:MAG: MraY family glycosyltransferase [Thermacetogeniaceae bacterium]|jgi:UDP-GlcNAc:undecaprenyl-phosphate GlcNAc-1-phosphate transferase